MSSSGIVIPNSRTLPWTPIQDTASTSRLNGLSAEEIRHAIADSKEENQARIHQHMAQILKKP